MSLVQDTLKKNLLNVFENMTDGDDSYFAKNVSSKIAEFAESGSITTLDAGTVSAGVFAGSGSGSISVKSSICENIIKTACEAMQKMTEGGNAYLAGKMAEGINSMMSAGTVKTDVKGTVTTPSGATSAVNGSAKGTFAGLSTTLQSGFLATFNKMDSMTENGDEYLAKEMASVITTYLKAGVITTNGQGILAGSVGSGSMS